MSLPLKDCLLKEYILANESWRYITGGSKCHWDPKTSKLKFQNNKPYYLCAFLGIIFGISSYYNSFTVAFGYTENQEFRSIAVTTLSGLIAVHFSAVSYLKHRPLFGELLNNMLIVEKHAEERIPDKLQNFKAAKLACWILRVTGVRLLGLPVGMVCVVAPRIPLNIFSYMPGIWILKCLRKDISSKIFGEIIEVILVFCGNFLYWSLYAKIALVLTIEIILCSTCFVKFVTCIEGNTKRFRFDTRSFMLFYRQLQLLLDSFNTIISVHLAVFSITTGFTQISVALELLKLSVSSRQSVTLSELASQFWISIFNGMALCNITVVIILLFGCCAEVYDTSYKVRARLKRRITMKTTLEHKLFLNSIPVLKIKFGSSNYLEKLTPVVFQSFLVQRLIDVLLVQINT